jgi:hypothetical protein
MHGGVQAEIDEGKGKAVVEAGLAREAEAVLRFILRVVLLCGAVSGGAVVVGAAVLAPILIGIGVFAGAE